tara:strand:- start:206 stop:352 length:147 start_codon:yes stop_codon:yes gene_type:complete
MRDISLGIMIGIIICMGILCYIPLTETEQACYNCGAMAWYFKPAKENK